MIKTIKKALYPFYYLLKKFWSNYVVEDRLAVICQKFKSDDIKFNLRYNYPLNENSVVFDLGGYKGEWSQKIWDRYHCNIFIFEPVQEFYKEINGKFGDNKKIHNFNFGISDKDEMVAMQIVGDKSNIFGKKNNYAVQFKDIKTVINELGLTHINLIKLNIEGGEFKVLPRLIKCGMIDICDDIQVQFHHFYPEAEKLRNEIRAELAKTHEITYDYEFTFENWRKKGRM